MGLELKQGLKLSQQLVMTPQLQQAIKLLQLNRMELAEVITQELTENPMLEEQMESIDGKVESGDSASDPEGEQRRDEEAFDKPSDPQEDLLKGKDDFNWESYIEDFNSNYSTAPSMREVNDDLPSFESVLTKGTSLEDHLEWQLSMLTLADNERQLGTLIIGNLSPDGYLTANLEDLAQEAEIDIEDAEEVHKMMMRFDPIGATARNLKECLSAQAQFLDPRQPIVEEIIRGHLPQLERKNYSAVGKAIGIPMEQVIESVKVIMELEPRPGRSFNSGDTQYITPDIYVHKVSGEYVIVMNEDGLPKLKISGYYKDILKAAKPEPESNAGAAAGDGNAPATNNSQVTKDYVQDKLKAAMWLIRSIHNRQKTIYKVTEAIVQRQQDFFELGVEHLKPMILKDVANDIGMHESTISRVTTNKYVHTPVGTFELKYFFNSSIGSSDGSGSMASEAVKEKIRQLVSKEDTKRPLSDQKIVEILKADNIDIARRTVAKYRDMLGILSSGKRKKVF